MKTKVHFVTPDPDDADEVTLLSVNMETVPRVGETVVLYDVPLRDDEDLPKAEQRCEPQVIFTVLDVRYELNASTEAEFDDVTVVLVLPPEERTWDGLRRSR